MSKVKDGQAILGSVERTNGGNWYAEVATDHTTWSSWRGIGAFPTKGLAEKAVRDWHAGQTELTGKIKPTFIVGGPARGMSA